LVLEQLGHDVGGDHAYFSLRKTARALRETGADVEHLEVLSAPDGTVFPIVETQDLYVREGYKQLYREIIDRFTDSPGSRRQNRIVVTGTPGIGKSAFLPYFIVRLLAQSDNDKPPIVVFQTKDERCFVYGGTSVVRTGKIPVFEDLLNLLETWYLVDSSDKPVLGPSKIIISASPRTLVNYKDVMKEVVWTYYLAPWDLQELEKCQKSVTAFSVVTSTFMNRLYDKIGGIPRYVLQKPADKFHSLLKQDEKLLSPLELADKLRKLEPVAEIEACRRIEEAIVHVNNPIMYIECMNDAEEHIRISGRIFHRWPTVDCKSFEYRWASEYIMTRIYERLDKQSWQSLLEAAIRDDTPGIAYEAFAAHIFRKGGHTFEVKELGKAAALDHLTIPERPPVTIYRKAADLSALRNGQTLYMPATPNFPCIDAALGPNKLFQLTLSRKHPIKQAEFEKIVNSILSPTTSSSSSSTLPLTTSSTSSTSSSTLPLTTSSTSSSTSSSTLNLYFVVPEDKFQDYTVQKYLTVDGKISNQVPKIVQDVKQFALKFNLKSASNGGSPGVEKQVP
jgi:hypothetical protein